MASPRAPRPLIGINADYLPPTKSAGAIARLAAGYADAIFQSGGIPVVLTRTPVRASLAAAGCPPARP